MSLDGVRAIIEAVNALEARALPRPPITLAYRLGLVLTALTMVLLPIVYLGFIALAVWGGWLYATNCYDVMRMRYGVVLYFAPLSAIAVLIFFMIKPLVAPRAHRQGRRLDPGTEPLLIEYVHSLCRVIGCRQPAQVMIEPDSNAAAGFDGGLPGMLRGTLTLHIGLPLLAGISVRQLSGVLAHEMGHFTQAGGMRLTWLIRHINAWLMRIAWEQDEWDRALAGPMKTNADEYAGFGGIIGIFGVVWLIASFVSRLLLRGLVAVGHAVATLMLRQMEYHADWHEVAMAGSDEFEATTAAMIQLDLAMEVLRQELQRATREKRAPDNILPMLDPMLARVPGTQREQMLLDALAQRTAWFDTHPGHADRIDAARRLAMPGLLPACDAPAIALLADPEPLAREVTLELYRRMFGKAALRISRNMVSADVALAKVAGIDERAAALRRVVQAPITSRRMLRLDPAAPVAAQTRDDLLATLQAARKALAAGSAAYVRSLVEYLANDNLVHAITIEGELQSQRLGNCPPERWQQRKAAITRNRELGPMMAAFEASACRRIECAVALGDDDHARELVAAVGALAALHPQITRLHVPASLAPVLRQKVEHPAHNEVVQPPMVEKLDQLEATMFDELTAIREKVAGVMVPAAPDERLSAGLLDDALFSNPRLSRRNGAALNGDALKAIERADRLYGKLMVPLGVAVEAIERDLGLDPLPDPRAG
ncbi:MAG: M48 family metalloprotease [Planctomycetota bacterium]